MILDIEAEPVGDKRIKDAPITVLRIRESRFNAGFRTSSGQEINLHRTMRP
jgi:hypothetical protein